MTKDGKLPKPTLFALDAKEYEYFKEMEKTIGLIKESVDNAVINGKHTITELGIQERINKLNKLKPKTNE